MIRLYLLNVRKQQFITLTERGAWLYTAITRAEAEIHLVGTEDDFKIITETMSNSHKRNSNLAELLM